MGERDAGAGPGSGPMRARSASIASCADCRILEGWRAGLGPTPGAAAAPSPTPAPGAAPPTLEGEGPLQAAPTAGACGGAPLVCPAAELAPLCPPTRPDASGFG